MLPIPSLACLFSTGFSFACTYLHLQTHSGKCTVLGPTTEKCPRMAHPYTYMYSHWQTTCKLSHLNTRSFQITLAPKRIHMFPVFVPLCWRAGASQPSRKHPQCASMSYALPVCLSTNSAIPGYPYAVM